MMIANLCKSAARSTLLRRFYSDSLKILGIESTHDDTSAAVVNDSGNVLGEGHFSQYRLFLESGGILPHLASALHRQYLKNVVETSMKQSLLDYKDLDAIAVAVKPGLILSLKEGVEYAKNLCVLHRKPLIPIHHMEAHALTARMIEDVKFPFLVFLISGGHAILALVKSVDSFYVLGEALHNSPGQAFDRVARRAKLQHSKKYGRLVGGAAIELAAEEGNPLAFDFSTNVLISKDCNFSFSGLWTQAIVHIKQEEKKYNTGPDDIIPSINDLCASYQWAMTKHLCQRLENAINYVDIKKLLTKDEKCLVVSGGVASNKFIRKCIKFVADHYQYKMVVPPPKLCTDNGIMIAWNGIERLKQNIPVVHPDNLDTVTPMFSCPLGENLSKDVQYVFSSTKFRYVRLKKVLQRKEDNAEESLQV